MESNSSNDGVSEEEEVNGSAPELIEDEGPDDSFHCFTGHSNSVFCVAWSPTNDLKIASGGQDDNGYLWQTWMPGTEITELMSEVLEGHTDSVVDIGFNYNGDLLATGGMDGVVKIWSNEGALLQTLEGPTDAVDWICWHPRGNVILAGSLDFSSWMWNAQNGTCMQVFTGHGSAVSCGRFSADGRLVITCGEDEDPSLKIWNPRTGECTVSISGHQFHEAGITSLDVNHEASLSLTGSSDTTARLCNLTAGHPTGTLAGHADSVESVQFAEGLLPVLLTGSLDGKVIVWDKQTLSQRHVYHHPEGVVCFDSPQESPVLVTGSLDGIVRVWDVRMSNQVMELHGFSAGIQCLATPQNAIMVMAGSDDSTVRIFDLRQH